ncbi:MAG TPA: hypothetical protein PK760_06340 [Flavobacteriales bacterium]|nr:hypothetical protein [Flavobacteriales bacterium]
MSDSLRLQGNILFYNVENRFDTKNDPATNDDDFTPGGEMHWTEKRYDQKLNQLAEAITMSGKALPIVIGLCEIENRAVVDDLVRNGPLASVDYTIVHYNSPDERGIDVALLVSPDAGQVVFSEPMRVDLEGDDATRDVLYARIRAVDGKDLHVFVNHWPSRREGEWESDPKRMIAATTVRKRVDAILAEDPKARIVIMGDLNDESNDASLLQGLRAATRMGDDADLYDLVAADHKKRSGSISRDNHWMYFDHLIVSKELLKPTVGGPRAVTAHSVKDDRLVFHHPRFGEQPNRTYSGRGVYHPNGFSDHLPVVLVLE